MVKNFIFLGAPGVGKGTLAKIIAKKHNMIHISTGDMFRKHITTKTPIGLKVKQILEAGDYVPDDITNEMVKATLEEVKDKGVILDGYPRTTNQAEFLNSINFDLKYAILLMAPNESIQRRLETRAKKENRKDDTPDVISARIKHYNEKTAPLINFYINEKKLIEIDAKGTVEENINNLEMAVFDD